MKARPKITYEKIHTWENLYEAFKKAAKGKRGHPSVAAFEFRLEDNLVALQNELESETYQPGGYVKNACYFAFQAGHI